MDTIKHVEFEDNGQIAALCGDCIVNARNAHDPLEVLGEAHPEEKCEDCGAYGGEIGEAYDRLMPIEDLANEIRMFAHFYRDHDSLPDEERVRGTLDAATQLSTEIIALLGQIKRIEKEAKNG